MPTAVESVDVVEVVVVGTTSNGEVVSEGWAVVVDVGTAIGTVEDEAGATTDELDDDDEVERDDGEGEA